MFTQSGIVVLLSFRTDDASEFTSNRRWGLLWLVEVIRIGGHLSILLLSPARCRFSNSRPSELTTVRKRYVGIQV